MSGNGTLSTQTTHDTQSWQNALEELQMLLAEPVNADTGITRAGNIVGLRVTPLSSQEQTQLIVSFFPLGLEPAQGDEENHADRIALEMFLDGLQAADLSTRLAACEALGQLGNPTTRPALTAAERDENWLVRTAARKALSALDTPRIAMPALSDLPVVLWQHVKHLWKPLGATKTDRRGEARFAHVSSGVVYRLQLLQTQHRTPRPTLILGARRPTNEEFLPEALAAESVETDVNTLPQSQRLVLEDDSLVCTVAQNEEEQLVIEFRSESSRLRNGWIYCCVTRRETREDIFRTLVELTPTTRGILGGRLLLGEEFDLTQTCEFYFELVSAPALDT
jgi:hypothetical protein